MATEATVHGEERVGSRVFCRARRVPSVRWAGVETRKGKALYGRERERSEVRMLT